MGVGAVKAGEAFVKVYSDDTDLVRGLRGIESKVMRVGTRIAGVGTQLAGMGAAVAGLGSVGLAALSWPLTLASNMEMAESQFTTLLKDGDKAKKLLAELQAFAASTPFQFEELSDAAKKLLAFGSEAKNVQAELKRIGDISSAIGAPIGEIAELYGKARIQGTLFAEDINQLTGRGIPIIQEFAKQLGVTDSEVKQLASDGKISFKNLERAFSDLTSGAGMFAGGMERSSKTLAGSFSTLRDNIAAAFRPFGEVLLPLAKSALEWATKVVAKFAEFAKNNRNIVLPLAAAFTAIVGLGGAATLAGIALVGIGSAISAIGAVAGAVGTVIGAIGGPLIAAIGAATVVVTGLYVAFGYVLNEAGLLVPAVQFIGKAFSELWVTFQQTFGGIVAALGSGQFGLAAQIAWAGVEIATLQGTQSVLQGIEGLWANAGIISYKFFVALNKQVFKAFSAMPKIAWAALRGGVGLEDALNEALVGAFIDGSISKQLDGTIDAAQKRLDALTAQASASAKPAGAAVAGVPPAAQAQIAQQQQQFAQIRQQAVLQPALPASISNTFLPNSPPGMTAEGFGPMVQVQEEQLRILKEIAAQGGLE